MIYVVYVICMGKSKLSQKLKKNILSI